MIVAVPGVILDTPPPVVADTGGVVCNPGPAVAVVVNAATPHSVGVAVLPAAGIKAVLAPAAAVAPAAAPTAVPAKLVDDDEVIV